MGIKDRIRKALGKKKNNETESREKEIKPSLKDLLTAYDAEQVEDGNRDARAYRSATDALEAGKGHEVSNEDLLRLVRYSQSGERNKDK